MWMDHLPNQDNLYDLAIMVTDSDPFSYRPKLQHSDAALRPTRAEIDLDALSHNLKIIRRELDQQRVYAVVKADAYGHGAVTIAKRLVAEGVDGFAVALVEEGIELREAGIDQQILILNGPYAGTHAEIIQYMLTPVIGDIKDLRAIGHHAKGRPIAIHLKVDTGMSRLGLPLGQVSTFLEELSHIQVIRLEGLMTHLARADDHRKTTSKQLALFEKVTSLVRQQGYHPTVIHAANSPGTIRHPEAHFDAVRVGLALYGLKPAPTRLSLQPLMRWRSEVISLRQLPIGTGVGYNHTFVAQRPTLLAAIPIGYGDGLMRALSNQGSMLVRGKRCQIVGNISMDLTTIDVTDLLECRIGDEVVVLGEQGDDRITADDLAKWANTINYEIVTNISRRVPRFYKTPCNN